MAIYYQILKKINNGTILKTIISIWHVQEANACPLIFRIYLFGSVFIYYITCRKNVIIDPIEHNKHVSVK